MSYEEDIEIDCDSLDVEWLDQPKLMKEYCRIEAEAARAEDLAKENLDFVRATIERAVRADPAQYGVTAGSRGITEDSIKAAIQVHPQFQAASREHIDAKYEHGVAKGTARAFDQRKSALERLVQLHGQSYFSGPSVPRNLAEERAKRDREAQAKVRIGKPAGAIGGSISVPVGPEHVDLDAQRRWEITGSVRPASALPRTEMRIPPPPLDPTNPTMRRRR
jgi:hypothetical protein